MKLDIEIKMKQIEAYRIDVAAILQSLDVAAKNKDTSPEAMQLYHEELELYNYAKRQLQSMEEQFSYDADERNNAVGRAFKMVKPEKKVKPERVIE